MGSSDTSLAEPMSAGWHDRILARLQDEESALAIEEVGARELLVKLLDLPINRADTLVRNSRKYHTWSLCQLLKKESHQILFREPRRGVEIAMLALQIAEGPLLKVASEALLNDLKGSCWTYLGNAHRAIAQFAEAEDAFAVAQRLLRQGTGDPLEAARLAEWKATLRTKQRRFDEATVLFDRAIKTFLSVGDRHAAGSAMLGQAVVASDLGEAQESIRLKKRAVEFLDAERDPRLCTIARHNLAGDLANLGAFADARQEVKALRAAHAKLGDTINLIRLRSLEGEIAFGLGEFDQAIAMKYEVRDAFASHGMMFDVAGVTLDLAAYHLRLNQIPETKRLASESLPLFHSLGIHREAITAFLVFQEAAEREAATVELVREIATYLRASRTNPELKFRA